MNKRNFKIGDLLVCFSGPDEDTLTLGYIVGINNRTRKSYTVHWVDDPDDVDMAYEPDTIAVFQNLLMENMQDEGKV